MKILELAKATERQTQDWMAQRIDVSGQATSVSHHQQIFSLWFIFSLVWCFGHPGSKVKAAEGTWAWDTLEACAQCKSKTEFKQAGGHLEFSKLPQVDKD